MTQGPDFRHVYACLVHERRECVSDLVDNLRSLDPASPVLLYNGGSDPHLLQGLQRRSPEIWIHPRPRPMRWGYLHEFALDSIDLAEERGGFDALTIVDSDQLCLRAGYSAVLRQQLQAHAGVGLFGTTSCEAPLTMPSPPALSAFAEIELWRPFLAQTPRGLATFPQWTFWPATVFTGDAGRALLDRFRQDRALHALLRRSAIWATEEVLLPSLVAALGFRVLRSPFDRTFVRFRREFTPEDVERALHRPGAFWMHPVPRDMSHPVRTSIRRHCLPTASQGAGPRSPSGAKCPS